MRAYKEIWELAPSEYNRHSNGTWYARSPNGLTANLSLHTVEEHSDGTITVSPSILVRQSHADGERSWHGYLERGIWRTC